MTVKRFILIALLCSVETILFNEALFNQDYLLVLLWGFFLFRDLQRIYLLSKFTDKLSNLFGKKD